MLIDFTKWGARRGTASPNIPPENGYGVVIGSTDRGAKVHWIAPSREHGSGALILGATGSGKSTLLAAAVLGDLLRPVPPEGAPSMLVIAPKADIATMILGGITASCPERLADIHWLDPFGAGGFPFNFCRQSLGSSSIDARAAQLAGLVAECTTVAGASREANMGARQIDLSTLLISACLACPHPDVSILWALDALTMPSGFERLAALTTSQRARAFLETTKISEELRISLQSRLRAAFGSSDQLERLVSAPTSVELGEILERPGQIVVLEIASPPAALASAQRLWANIVGRLAIERLLERPSPFRGHHCRVWIDEAAVVASSLSVYAELLFAVGRSRNISVVIGTQSAQALAAAAPQLLPAILTNVGVKFVGRIPASDADVIARDQAPARGVDEPIAAVRSRFVTTLANLDDREFIRLAPRERTRFRTVELPLAAWERASDAFASEHQAIKSRYALGRDARRVTLAQASQERRREHARMTVVASAPTTNVTRLPAHADRAVDASIEPQAKPPRPRSRWG